MKHLFIILPLLVLPVVGLTLASRWIWTTVLGLLAGMGMACAKQTDNQKSQSNERMVTCYEPMPMPSVLEGTPWAYSEEMEAWANAEHGIIDMLRGKGKASLQYDDLQKLITAAELAGRSAKVVVDRKQLHPDTYTMAMEVLINWHRDVAITTTAIKCYEKMVTPPYIDDINSNLMTINQLQAEGKLDDKVVAQVKAGIKERLGKETKPEVAEELSLLLVSLLYK